MEEKNRDMRLVFDGACAKFIYIRCG